MFEFEIIECVVEIEKFFVVFELFKSIDVDNLSLCEVL